MSERRLPLLLPTKIFAALAFVLAAMWYAGASQNNAAAYLLLFVTLSLFLVSAPHTLLNLTGLKVTAESITATFAGREISVPIELVNESRKARHGLVITLPDHTAAPEIVEQIPARKAARVTLRFPATVRGEYDLSRLRLSSVYPLGFLKVTRPVAVSQRYLVYPNPAGDPNLPVRAPHTSRPGAEKVEREGDDFAGVRSYVTGESQRHIDWKAVARGQPMMTKQFAAETDGVLQLDFQALSLGDVEQRLSQLALWVIEAERARRRYGLRLPGTEIAPSSGEVHYRRCLHALAVYR